MDAIITYVNGLDPEWQANYRQFAPSTDKLKRFRDWGTLPYLLRGIEANMPFVENIFLVVARESQVPQWVDRSRLNIVLHSDIIPQNLLPVFNSCTIEMFLHRTPRLAEEFIYFNDDMFPLAPSSAADFFPGGKPSIGMSRHLFAGNLYKQQCRTSDRMARKALGLNPSLLFLRPQHICSPMLKSQCEEAYQKLEADILATASPLRTATNPNQYLFLDYMYHKGLLTARRLSNKHISQGVWSAEKIAHYIEHPQTTLACINDVEMSDEHYNAMKQAILNAFQKKYPNKSQYEL
ncbi:MAG: hypothetical protein K5864_00400 [Bacteroidales bacterium]|nr:hypothetical protein [Bacteroidales bacterium]